MQTAKCSSAICRNSLKPKITSNEMRVMVHKYQNLMHITSWPLDWILNTVSMLSTDLRGANATRRTHLVPDIL